ncbi:MAG: Histidine phosphatase family protein [Cyanobacteriota bacterium erpe_2018_sw_39hr_WHONDRS-SW48-000098_B_bin.30]|jgi:broad specificity phosphatase PhoE|nr:Histidine phosphatase family protein [Cyanobacteriota bacterium erpe_2018_sw_39hr_WHONDRS-SW48-000098_B_bin.30]
MFMALNHQLLQQNGPTMSEELHPLEEITSIFFVRHGHTPATEMGLLYSDPKLELTTKGISQAAAAAHYIGCLSPDVIVRGSAVRVAQSAAPIEELLNKKAHIVDGFEEWQVGDWEGRTYLDIKKNDPDQYHAWSADPINNRPPNGESIADLCSRIGEALQALLANKDYAGKKICMVTHSGIIRSVLVHALGMPVNNFWRLSIPTGSISRIDYSQNFATVHFTSNRPVT